MRPSLSSLLRHMLAVLLLALGCWVPAQAQLAQRTSDPARSVAPAPHSHEHDALDALLNKHDQEIHFTENKGQFGPTVLYRADFPLGQAVATREGMLVTAFDPSAVEKRQKEGIAIEAEIQRGLPHRPLTWQKRGHGWMFHFLNASPYMRIESEQAHTEVANYFLGNKDQHSTNVNSFQEVWYRDVYPATDVRYYPAADGSLEYDIICKPGSDPKQVAIELRGIERVRKGANGELVMSTSLGDMSYPAPVVYQRVNGRETKVDAAYVIDGKNVVRFALGTYDRTQPLVIDPIAMRWATWVNTNSTGDNHGHCIWVDPNDGAIYVVARVVGTTDQITVGAFDTSANGNLEMIVGKYLEPATVGGSGTRVWQTYIGGNNDDNPYAMEQGPDGNLYITGYTGSTNFPLIGGTAFTGSSVNQQAQTGDDVFVLKVNTAGNSIKAAVLGGNGSDDSYDLRTASNGDVFVCGSTTSTNLLTLNAGSGASNTNNGGSDVLLFRLNQDLASLVWMRNYGGSGADQGSIMLHNPTTGDLFVGGNTSSTNFPTVSPRQASRGGTSAGFIQRMTGAGTTTWSSYFSSDSNDDANLLCMAFNSTRSEIYFGGVTEGLNSANISSSGVWDTSHNGSNDFYVARLSVDQAFLGGTYIGGSGDEVNMMGLNLDDNNDVYVFGYTSSTNFPTSTAPNVPLQSSNQGNNDKVFFKLESDLSALEFSTYYGGAADDYDPVGERGIKFSNCRIYTIITARSNNIPLTQGALNTTKNSTTSRYEPGLVVWANPPDLLGNTITSDQIAICAGSTPGTITGSVPSYVLPTVIRNNSTSTYPSFGSAATYQWQISTDSVNWSNISGATTQNLTGAQIGPINQLTYVRRIIGGDACILAGAADQVVTVRLMRVSATTVNVTCNGAANGSITATADGLAPFTYAWSNGQTGQTATGLAPGSYTVTVTDANGCSAQGTFAVTQPAVLGGQTTSMPATCANANGGASASGSGGTSPYTYLWSNGSTGSSISGVQGGGYSVTITDAKACTVVLQTNIPSTGLPSVNAGDDAVITCTTGASIQLNGSGSAGVSFAWTASNGGNIVSGANTANPVVNATGTYTLLVTNMQTGCSASDLAIVTSNTSPPNASVTGGGTLTCTTTSLLLNGGSTTSAVTFSWSGPNGFSSTDEDVIVSVAGTYVLTVMGTNGCTATANAQVGENLTLPGATSQGGTLTCSTTSIQLMGTGNGTYGWTGPDNYTSALQSPTVSVAGTYVLTVTGANGCTSTANAEVNEDLTLPGATAQGGTLTCTTTSIQLMGTGNGAYAWSGPNNFTSTLQNPTVSVAGTYVLTVTGTNGCTSTANATVGEDLDLPSATAQGGTLTCTTTSIQLMGTGNGTYAWTGPNNFTSTLKNPTVSVAGTYVLTVTGANGCTSTANAIVDTDLDLPGATAQGGTLTCTTTSIQLIGAGNGTYAWTGPNNFTSMLQNPMVGMAGTYQLTVTGANGCTSTATAVVEQDDETPGAQATGGTLTCATMSIQLTGTGNGTYDWSGPNNFTSALQNPTVSIAGTYTLTVTGANGCTSTANAEVVEDLDLPSATAQGGTLTCTTTSIQLMGAGNGTYAWTGPNNFTSMLQNPVVGMAGTYQLTVTGANGCTSTATAVVEQDDETPGAQATGGTLTCTTTSIQLMGTGNGTYSWTGPNNFTSALQNPTVSIAGTYTLTVTGANGCTSTANAEVDEDLDLPGATAQGGTLTCTTTSIQLMGAGNGTYAWTGPNNFASMLQNPVVGMAGTYQLTVTGANGCTSTATAVVEQDDETPGAQATGGTLTCATMSIQLMGAGNGTYAWTGPNNFTSMLQNPVVGMAGTYQLTVTGANGCTSTATAVVEQDDETPGAQATGGTLTCATMSIQLTGTGNGTYDWTGPNNFTSALQNPTVSIAGTYTLTVTGANGCTSTANAEVDEDLDLPGATAQGGTLTCTTTSIQLMGAGNGTYAWTGPNNFTSMLQNPVVGMAGTYQLTVTGANGCTSTATAEVGQDDGVPGATAQGGTLTCATTSVQLMGTGNGTYAWTGPNNFTSTLQNPTVSVAGTYTLTVTGANDCTSNANAEVDEDLALPGATAQGGTLTCTTTSIQLMGTGNGTYSWTGPNNFSSALQSPSVSIAGTYVLTVTGANGCTSTANAIVGEDLALPGATAQGGTLTCSTTSLQLMGAGNGTHAWTGPNNFTSSLQNPTVSVVGTYILTVTGANGCTSTASAEVGQNDGIPGAHATGGTLTCTTTSIQLMGTGNGTYDWSGPNNFTSALQNPTVSVAGTYTLTVTGANGCTSTASADVSQDNDVPVAIAEGGTLTCTTNSMNLMGGGFGTFAWSGPNDFSSTEQDPTVSVGGTYVLTVTAPNGCTSTATAEVLTDMNAPYASANGGSINCTNAQVILTGNGNGTFAWTGPNGFTSAQQFALVSVAGTYILTVTGANGCTATASTQVIADTATPEVSILGGVLPCEGGSLVLTGIANIINAMYAWTGPDGFTSSAQGPAVTEAGTYTLIVTASNGCAGQASTTVLRDCDEECPPMIVSCPDDITVQCAEDFSPGGIVGTVIFRQDGEYSADDKKDKKCPAILKTGWGDEFLSACPFVIRRTYWAVDEAGNTESCVQLITVVDEVAPIFENVPADLTMACSADMDNLQLPAVWAYDECTKTIVLATHQEELIPGDCPNEYDVIHTWTAEDYCRNSSTVSWTVHVVDNEAPVFSCHVQDMIVAEGQVPEAPNCPATDNCAPEIKVVYSEEIVGDEKDKGYAIVRHWSATDACGNMAEQTQTIVVVDKKPSDAEKMIHVTVAPNPFRENCTVTFEPMTNGKASVVITDLQGRRVSEPFNGTVTAGQPVRVVFTPVENGSGTYLYRIQLNGAEARGRLIHQP